MPKLKMYYLYSCKESPDGKLIKVIEDIDGFLWLPARIAVEGWSTPFNSIEEIEVVHNLSDLIEVSKQPVA